MRLSDILSKPFSSAFEQVENFAGNRHLPVGRSKKINAGRVALNFYCKTCEDVRTFCSGDELFCIPIHDKLFSIDCGLRCTVCDVSVPTWFLLEIKDDVYAPAPAVRIVKRNSKFPEQVLPYQNTYGNYSALLEKAERAYREELGAGAVVYLRKILELVTFQAADAAGIETKKDNGNPKPFRQILEKVEETNHIIPSEFSANGYRLFGELSDVVHGEYDEELGLKKYDALKRLVIGVLDNVKNNSELMAAIGELGWNAEEGEAT